MRAEAGLITVLLVAAVATAGCLDQITGAISRFTAEDPAPPPADVVAGPLDEALGPGYNKSLSLDVQPGHVRIVLTGTLSSTPASPVPVKAPGTVKITLKDPSGKVARVIDLPTAPNPPATPSYTSTVEV
ncbi:MAG TPA: hypothetical protein VNZ52_15080 [Candidatus Thermoplasmatota archaeon]|nr:hypothetical protein [Candidatus Thermoplasmatota archaeon]